MLKAPVHTVGQISGIVVMVLCLIGVFCSYGSHSQMQPRFYRRGMSPGAPPLSPVFGDRAGANHPIHLIHRMIDPPALQYRLWGERARHRWGTLVAN